MLDGLIIFDDGFFALAQNISILANSLKLKKFLEL